MSATLWIDTEKDEAISFGETFTFYAGFAEMAKLAGEDWSAEYADLAGVPSATADVLDADPEWLAAAREQAVKFLRQYGSHLTQDTRNILESLTD